MTIDMDKIEAECSELYENIKTYLEKGIKPDFDIDDKDIDIIACKAAALLEHNLISRGEPC